MKNRGNKGFTLIELLVVIAIIGILASVVLASLNTARRKARDAQRQSDIKQIKLAMEFYFDDCAEYPDTMALAENSGCPAGSGITFEDYLPQIPVAPAGGGIGHVYNKLSDVLYCVGVDMEADSAVPGDDTDCDADGAGTFDFTVANTSAYSTSP
jgi:prepilin-type N-terminal cleavage/methylation domain-containing protein